jgi:hypothetical protein
LTYLHFIRVRFHDCLGLKFYLHASNCEPAADTGAERQLLLVATGSMIRGWDMHVLTLASGGKHWAELAESERIKLHSLDHHVAGFPSYRSLYDMSGKHQIGIVHGWMQPCNNFAARRGGITRRDVVLGVGTRSRSARIGPRAQLRSEPARAGEVGPGYGDTIFPMACFLPQRPFAPPFAACGPLCIGMLERVDPVQG